LNKATITQNFCENKSKPKMHCNGKCHLKKQLAKDDKKQESMPFSSKEKSEIQFYSQPSVSAFQLYCTNRILPCFAYLFSDTDCNPSSVFHPPIYTC
jgi:hypothetical protein